jgi:hypothetical protein
LKALQPGTTLGDLAYSSATANTNTRLAVGANGTYLTVTAGVPAWGAISAGGMTLLSTTSLSGATTTISSINQTYVNLVIFVSGVTNATNDGELRVAPNATTNITTIFRSRGSSTVDNSQNDYLWLNSGASTLSRTNANNSFFLQINNYSSTTAYKSISVNGVYFDSNNGSWYGVNSGGGIQTNSAISSLVFSNSGGNLSTGTVLIYGVK